MRIREAFRMALEAIRSNKLRGFFTVLGTVVGVTFLIAVITLIEGMNAYVEKEVKGTIYGVNSITIRRRPSISGDVSPEQWREWARRPRLSFDDAEWLAERIETPGTLALSADNVSKAVGPGGREVENVWVTGATASYFEIRDTKMESGRPFTPSEADRGSPVVVIGQDVATSMFPGLNPIGKEIRIQSSPYRVIGVLQKQGKLLGISMDNVAIAPIRSNVDGFVNNGWRGTVDEMTFKVDDAAAIGAAKEEIESWMRVRHRLRPGETNSFELETADESLAFWDKIRSILLIALPGLVSISLVVGAVVIMNIMLVSVAQRTREVGLRKSLGARRQDIVLQFLFESATLSGLGAVLGIGLGVMLASAVRAASSMPTQVAPWSVGLALLLGVGVGMAAGVYPAIRASRLDPIVALRAD